MTTERQASSPTPGRDTRNNRRVRIFVSSTFRDMIEERDELMSHTWPELRRFCRELDVELVEVDMRWGISEEQSTRKQTLKLCLDEIRSCRPYFIGLLGERYGWTPGDDAFTADLKEEQSWLAGLSGKSVTELEILHGVLNNPDMAGRSFFYLRDPAYAQGRGPDSQCETRSDAAKQAALKELIRQTSNAQSPPIPLRENYPDPRSLAAMVLADLKSAIEDHFPRSDIPDPLARESAVHEAFAEIRRRTYIGRPDYFTTLDNHARADGGPLVLLGVSGSGKSTLLANWLKHWHERHPNDLIIQHYIGGTSDSADHWRLMTRLMAYIKRWCDDPDALPTSDDDILKGFPLWLSKARARAQHHGVRCILVLDALNQLEDRDHARLLGWLPEYPFNGPLRLVVSTLPGAPKADDPLAVAQKRGWSTLHVQPLTIDERRRMIAHYLERFGKKLDGPRLDRLAAAPAAANPLYLKILLDELRVTGTHDLLDERLTNYLATGDIPQLLRKVLARYQRNYERDRPGLVREALGLIWAARRGLSETELLQLLRPPDRAQLPPATWSPLRAALEESLVDRGGILNFAHDFLRAAVEQTFVSVQARQYEVRMALANFFEAQPISARSCDELPWLLRRTDARDRLRACVLDIDRFVLIRGRDESELRSYWVWLKEERSMGKAYLAAFESWSMDSGSGDQHSRAANVVAQFLYQAALHAQAEPLMRRALAIDEASYGKDHPRVAVHLNDLAELLRVTNRVSEAEPLMRRGLAIDEASYGKDHPNVAIRLNNLALLLRATNRLFEAEPLMRRGLAIDETSYGKDHPDVAICLNNLAQLLYATNRLSEAEPLMRRALAIDEASYGKDHPTVAIRLNNLAELLRVTNRVSEAEPLMRRALAIDEASYGKDHPEVAICLNNLASLLQATNRVSEAEPLMQRALAIDEASYGEDHPRVAIDLNNLASLLYATNRVSEAEPLMRRALAIDEASYGKDHPTVAIRLDNLAELLRVTNRVSEAEPLMRRALAIDEASYGEDHPRVAIDLNNLASLLYATNRVSEAEPLMRRALAIDEASYGKDHPNVAICLNNLAELLRVTNRVSEAEPLMRRALEAFLKLTVSTGHEHPHLRAALGNYAQLLTVTGLSEADVHRRLNDLRGEHGMSLGHEPGSGEQMDSAARYNRLLNEGRASEQAGVLDGAVECYSQALAILEEELGADHDMTLEMVFKLEELAERRGDHAMVEPLQRRIVAAVRSRWGDEHVETALAVNNLAVNLREQGKLEEAEHLFRRALDVDQRLRPPGDPKIPHRLNNVAAILLLRDKLAESAQHNARGWQLKADRHDITSARILVIRAALALRAGAEPGIYVGQLKTLLAAHTLDRDGDVTARWDASTIVAHFHGSLPRHVAQLLAAVITAMNQPAAKSELEALPAWAGQAPVGLDAPWPPLSFDSVPSVRSR